MNEEKPAEQPVLDAEIVEETVAPNLVPPTFDYTDGGVPTLDYVRDRIENKFATSVGATELAEETPQGRSLDEQAADRDRAGRDKLEEIRRAMRGE